MCHFLEDFDPGLDFEPHYFNSKSRHILVNEVIIIFFTKNALNSQLNLHVSCKISFSYLFSQILACFINLAGNFRRNPRIRL